jgi:RsiW-degrading membrane proteinase PrsW (M82 family)
MSSLGNRTGWHRRDDGLVVASPLRRRHACGGICAVLLGLLGFATFVHLAIIASFRIDMLGVFCRALALSSVLSIVPLGILWFLDRREREHPWLFAAAFLWGACIATAISAPVNIAFFGLVADWVARNPAIIELLGPEAAVLLAAPVSAPIIEEIAKALGVLLIFWLLRDEFDNMRDGIVYGALVGLGFNWYEAALYVAQGYAQYGVAPYGLQLGVRYALFGLGGHALFTGIFGAFLGFAMQTSRPWLRAFAPIAGLALAIAAHALNNLLPLVLALAGGVDDADAEREIGFFDSPSLGGA